MTAPVEMLDLASQVLAYERSRQTGDGPVPIEAAFRGLYGAMSKLVGTVGCEAILRRAIHLNKAKHPWLEDVPVGSPIELERLAERANAAGEPEASNGAIALFATVLHLFSTFIGNELTLQQVRQVWNELPLDTLTSSRGTN